MNYADKFETIYETMRKSADASNMKTFGMAAKKMFKEMAEHHPTIAEKWLSELSPIMYHNFLSPKEAEEIVAGLVNQDGSIGPHWGKEVFAQMLNRLGAPVEDEPYYNKCALWVAANMVYSDHAESIAEDMGINSPNNVPAERMAKSCYRKAVERLKDTDRPHFIRWYFHLI